MPRKTRKQKIAASQRRFLIRSKGDSEQQVILPSVKDKPGLPLKKSPKTKAAAGKSVATAVLVNPSQIKKDLLKTLLISLFAILSEGVLYWLWQAN